MPIFCHNQSALYLATNHRLTNRTKYFLVKWHWFWQFASEFECLPIASSDQRADYLTKPLSIQPFESNRFHTQGWWRWIVKCCPIVSTRERCRLIGRTFSHVSVVYVPITLFSSILSSSIYSPNERESRGSRVYRVKIVSGRAIYYSLSICDRAPHSSCYLHYILVTSSYYLHDRVASGYSDHSEVHSTNSLLMLS